MPFDLSVAPADGSSTCKRQVATYTGPNPYVPGVGDVVNPEDVRMGKVFAILGLIAVGAQPYLLFYTPDNGAGDPAIFWYDPTTGLEVGAIDLSTSAATVEVIGQ